MNYLIGSAIVVFLTVPFLRNYSTAIIYALLAPYALANMDFWVVTILYMASILVGEIWHSVKS